MPQPYHVALLGFSAFERGALATCFRLSAQRVPAYDLVSVLDDGSFVIADADHAPSVQLVQAIERTAETVFIGQTAPAGALAWMRRPIDPLNVMRELDAMVAARQAQQDAARPTIPPTPPVPGPVAAGWPAPAAALLPARPSRPVQRAAPRVAAPMPLLTGAARPQSALLVDDSEIALRFLQSRLAPWGLRTACASTSAQALQLLDTQGFDLAFVDVELGPYSELDGLALCQQIRQQHHPATGGPSTLVMVSAHHSQADRVRGALAGCEAYLGKPLDEGELVQVLRRHGLKPLAAGAAAAPPSR